MTVKDLFAGGGIEVFILENGRGQIKLGVEAPMLLNVDRDEILEEW
jgi:sRNA-binding carbon storage regulator CsrA